MEPCEERFAVAQQLLVGDLEGVAIRKPAALVGHGGLELLELRQELVGGDLDRALGRLLAAADMVDATALGGEPRDDHLDRIVPHEMDDPGPVDVDPTIEHRAALVVHQLHTHRAHRRLRVEEAAQVALDGARRTQTRLQPAPVGVLQELTVGARPLLAREEHLSLAGDLGMLVEGVADYRRAGALGGEDQETDHRGRIVAGSVQGSVLRA